MKVFLICLFLMFLHISVCAQQTDANEHPTAPGNCETNTARLDYLQTEAREAQAALAMNVVIIIARLGDGEYNIKLNQRRLYTVKKYLGSSVTNLITAQGERVKGYGRIEVYMYGVLKEVLLIKKCQDLLVGSCDNDSLDFKKYQLPRPKRKIKCR